MILAFAHPGIVVPDLEKAIKFYNSMFGFRVIGNEGWENSDAYDQAIGVKGSAAKGRDHGRSQLPYRVVRVQRP